MLLNIYSAGLAIENNLSRVAAALETQGDLRLRVGRHTINKNSALRRQKNQI